MKYDNHTSTFSFYNISSQIIMVWIKVQAQWLYVSGQNESKIGNWIHVVIIHVAFWLVAQQNPVITDLEKSLRPEFNESKVPLVRSKFKWIWQTRQTLFALAKQDCLLGALLVTEVMGQSIDAPWRQSWQNVCQILKQQLLWCGRMFFWVNIFFFAGKTFLAVKNSSCSICPKICEEEGKTRT